MAVSRSTLGRLWGAVLFLLIGALVVHWWNRFSEQGELVTVRRSPVGVMGTSCDIVAVLPSGDAAKGAGVLDAAEAELRRLEPIFSTWIELSELSAINAAGAGQEVPLSPQVVDLLSRARDLFYSTQGAFDITAGPIIQLWRAAVTAGAVPTTSELDAARRQSSWEDFELRSESLVKRRSSARLDVDGVAKGYAIDRAIDALARAGAIGGLVDIGGDLRTFGVSPAGGPWPIGIQDPLAASVLGRIELANGAVCTSGSYARPVVIDGREHSHIIDPRTGLPATAIVSATVIGEEAAEADGWATALSVMGAEGLALLPAGIDALVLENQAGTLAATATAAFPELAGDAGLAIERRGLVSDD